MPSESDFYAAEEEKSGLLILEGTGCIDIHDVDDSGRLGIEVAELVSSPNKDLVENS
jgi:hypothetical protein